MADNSQEALDELLQSLRSNNARAVADEIAGVIARGVTEEMEVKGKIKELSQRALNSDEAYKVAVEMLVASLEAAVMKEHTRIELEQIMNMKSSIVWLQDFVEKSPVSPENYEDVSIPDSGGVEKLEEDLISLVRLISGA